MTSGPKRFTTRGFTCRGRYDDTSLPTVHWRCVRDDAVVRFDRS